MTRCETCHFQPCRCEDLAAGYMLPAHTPGCWPMRSDALGCTTRQVPAMLERNKRHGIKGVSYDKDGTCILADRAARKALCKLERVHDNSGGYGDA